MKVDGELPPLILSIEQLRKRLTVATKQDLMVALKQISPGKYLLPLEAVMGLGMEVLDGDTIRKKEYQTRIKKISDDKADGSPANVTVSTGKVWEVLAIQASFLADANVADRSCALHIPSIGMGGIAGTWPNTLLTMATQVTLSASQYGYIVVPSAYGDYHQHIDNGTISQVVKRWSCPLWLNVGANIKAIITANPQATDKTGIDVLYREYDLEE